MSSTFVLPICTTCSQRVCQSCTLHRNKSPFGAQTCVDNPEQKWCACGGPGWTWGDVAHPGANPFGVPYDEYAESIRKGEASNSSSSPSNDLHAIHASIARIEEKVDRLHLLERTLRREKSTQPEGEVNQKTQLREKRLEKDNLLLRTMLADALKLLSDE